MLWTAPTLRHQSAKGWWREASGIENRNCCWQRKDTNWRGHDDVMQTRRSGDRRTRLGHRTLKCVLTIGTRSEALGLRKVYIADTRSEPRKNSSEECVYFIKCKQHIKIGLTSRPIERRLYALSSSSADEMKVLGTIKNASASVEHALHERFTKYRVRGEWFTAAPEILAYIKEIKAKE
jgi:hypothetical protein